MAAVSAWGKPGAWALDAEEHDAAIKDKGYDTSDSAAVALPIPHQPSEELFPSLAAAASTKTKKKKPQTVSLAEFTTGRQPVAPYRPASSRPLPSNDGPLVLPTGPRERTAEELERGGGGRGFGYSPSFGRGGRDDSSRDEPRRGGGGFDRESDGPSRADEADDWGAGKRSLAPPPVERRERGTGGFFSDSQSRADDSNSWVSNKTAPPLPSRTGGFDGPPRERRGVGFETSNRDGQLGGGADSDTWGRRRDEPSTGGGGGRPRLALQPRTQPLANNNNTTIIGEQPAVAATTVRAKGSNPFGEARPREEVLKEKGKDWKEIDEKLDATKIRETLPEGQQLGKKGFMNDAEDRTERAWRKPDTGEAPRVGEPNELPGN